MAAERAQFTNLSVNSLLLNGQPLSLTSNVTITAIPDQISLMQTNSTNLLLGLAEYGSPSTCTWANVSTDAYGRVQCTSNGPPLLSLDSGVGTYYTSRAVNTYFASVKDYGAIGDGVADDYVPVQKALSDVNARSIFFPSGTYRTSRTLLFNVTGKFVYGFGDAIISPIIPLSSAQTLLGTSAPYVTVKGLVLDGGSAGNSVAASVAIFAACSSHLALQNLVLRNTNTYGIFCFGSVPLINITVDSSSFSNFLGLGGMIQMAGPSTIEDVIVSNNYATNFTSGFAIGPTGVARNSHITYTGNRMFGGTVATNTACIYLSNTRGGVITNNLCQSTRFGTSTNKNSGVSITANTFIEAADYALETLCDDNMVVSANTFENCGSGVWRRTALCSSQSQLSITGNTWTSPNFTAPFYISGIANSRGVSIVGNAIFNGTIAVSDTTGFTVSGNTGENVFIYSATSNYDGVISSNSFHVTTDIGSSTCVVTLLGSDMVVSSNSIVSETVAVNSGRGICNDANGGAIALNNTVISSNFISNFAVGINTGVSLPPNYNTRHTDNAFDRCTVDDLGASTDAIRPQRIAQSSAQPTGGQWKTGDIVWNSFSGGFNGAPLNWISTGSGWLVSSTLGGPYYATFITDASTTLTPGSSRPLAFYQAAITANRAVTLSTTGVWPGIMWTVVRGRASTGAFNITGGAGAFLCVLQQPGQWCSWTYGNAQYILVGGGTIPI